MLILRVSVCKLVNFCMMRSIANKLAPIRMSGPCNKATRPSQCSHINQTKNLDRFFCKHVK